MNIGLSVDEYVELKLLPSAQTGRVLRVVAEVAAAGGRCATNS